MPLLDLAYGRTTAAAAAAAAASSAGGEGDESERSPSPVSRRTGYATAAQRAMSSRRPKHIHAHQHSLAGHPMSPLAFDPAMQVDPSLEALASHTSTSVSTHSLPPSGDAALTRKAQNRLAQREFRQRKQEYIRALECRVELLSSEPKTQIDRVRWLLRQLMLENAKLRVLLGVVAAHIAADGVGGFLGAHAGVRSDLEQFVFNPSERRALAVWDPHSDDSDGHLALNTLRVQSQLPPEASLVPVESARIRSFPTLPNLRHAAPVKRKRSSADDKKSQEKKTRCERSPTPPSPTSPTSPLASRDGQQVPATTSVDAPSSSTSAAPATTGTTGAPAPPASSLPAWGGLFWPPMTNPFTGAPAGGGPGPSPMPDGASFPPASISGDPTAPPSSLNPLQGQGRLSNTVFAALYRARMSLGPPEPAVEGNAGGAASPAGDVLPGLASPQGPRPQESSSDDVSPPQVSAGTEYVAMPASPTAWAWQASTTQSQA